MVPDSRLDFLLSPLLHPRLRPREDQQLHRLPRGPAARARRQFLLRGLRLHPLGAVCWMGGADLYVGGCW